MDRSPLEIFIDARTVRPGMTGVGRYTLGLLDGMAELAAEGAAIGVRAAVLPSAIAGVRSDPRLAPIQWVELDLEYESHPAGDLGLRRRVPRLVRPGEVYHGPAFIIPGGRGPFARVVSIHDLGVFRRRSDFPYRFAAYLRWAIRRAVAAADRVIVPSQAIAAELSEEFPRAEGRVHVVPQARARGIAAWGGLVSKPGARPPAPSGEPWFVSVATLEPRKDPITAIEALERLDRDREEGDPQPVWLWIGGPGFRGQSILKRIAGSPAAGRFRVLGFREDPDVESLIAGARALVYPSRYEGFGLPPLDAMALGVPVVASDLPVLRELCADAALYFPPGDAGGLARQLAVLLRDPDAARDLAERGRRRAAAFSWRRTAQATVEVYDLARRDRARAAR